VSLSYCILLAKRTTKLVWYRQITSYSLKQPQASQAFMTHLKYLRAMVKSFLFIFSVIENRIENTLLEDAAVAVLPDIRIQNITNMFLAHGTAALVCMILGKQQQTHCVCFTYQKQRDTVLLLASWTYVLGGFHLCFLCVADAVLYCDGSLTEIKSNVCFCLLYFMDRFICMCTW
jgi:hypothetical protein